MKTLFQKKKSTNGGDATTNTNTNTNTNTITNKNYEYRTPQKSKKSKFRFKKGQSAATSSTPPVTTPSPPTSPLPIKIISKRDDKYDTPSTPTTTGTGTITGTITGTGTPNRHPNPNGTSTTMATMTSSADSILSSIIGSCGIMSYSSPLAINDSLSSPTSTSRQHAARQSQIQAQTLMQTQTQMQIPPPPPTPPNGFDGFAQYVNVPSMMNWDIMKELTTIPEEKFSTWGVPPSDDDDDDDMNYNDTDYFGENSYNDSDEEFECVLQSPNRSTTDSATTTTTATTNMNSSNSNSNNDAHRDVLREYGIVKYDSYCQPCDDDDDDDDDNNNNNNVNNIIINSRNNGGHERPHFDRNDVLAAAKSKETNSTTVVVDAAATAVATDAVADETRVQSGVEKKKRPIMQRLSSNSDNDGASESKKSFKLFQKNGPDKRRNRRQQQQSKKQQKQKRSNRSKQKKQQQQQQKKGKWKWAKDEQNRIYYYHTLTRQVSWNKPPTFQTFKAIFDTKTNRFYFYNVITKETTWSQPKDFEVWREVEDKGSGRVYYYNVLTRESRWKKPMDDGANTTTGGGGDDDSGVEQQKGVGAGSKIEVASDMNNNTRSMTTAMLPISTGTTDKEEITTTFSGSAKLDRGELMEKDYKENSIPLTVKEAVIESVSKEQNQKEIPGASTYEEPGQIIRSSDQQRLRKLLYTYCPDEKENNDQLLSKAKGTEEPIIKGIQNLIADTPFDELRLVIFSFVKETLRGMGEQPFDEKPTFGKFAGNLDARVVALKTLGVASPSYSMNGKMLSTMTAKSNISHSTQTVNNTSTARQIRSNPYSMAPGKSSISHTTVQVKNTSRGKGDMKVNNKPDPRSDIFHTSDFTEKGNSSSIEELTETEEEDLTMNEAELVVNMESIKLSEKSKSDCHADGKEIKRKTKPSFGIEPISRLEPIVHERYESFQNHKNKNRKVAAIEMNDNMDDTIESAYAGDNDDLSGDEHYSFDDDVLDDISALSESIGRPSRKRRNKEAKKKSRKPKPSSDERSKVRFLFKCCIFTSFSYLILLITKRMID